MSKIKLGGDTFGVTFHLWTTTSYSQSKSPNSCKTTTNRGIYWVLLIHQTIRKPCETYTHHPLLTSSDISSVWR